MPSQWTQLSRSLRRPFELRQALFLAAQSPWPWQRPYSTETAVPKHPEREQEQEHLQRLWDARSLYYLPQLDSRRSRSSKTQNAACDEAALDKGAQLVSLDQPMGPNSDLQRANDFFHKIKPKRTHLYSAEKLSDHPINTVAPEVIVFGISNAGKSTLVNAVLGQQVAHAGKAPGKTKLLHAYAAGPPLRIPAAASDSPRGASKAKEKPPQHSLVLVDTPGYGFNSRTGWGRHVVDYLRKRVALRGALVLIRGYAGIQDGDRLLLEQLSQLNVPTQVILTRMDEKSGDESHQLRVLGEVNEALLRAETVGHPEWRRGVGWMEEIYLTAAGFLEGQSKKRKKIKGGGDAARGGNAGVMGVRMAILRLAGGLSEDAFIAARLRREAVLRDLKAESQASPTDRSKRHERERWKDEREGPGEDEAPRTRKLGAQTQTAPQNEWTGELVSFEDLEKLMEESKDNRHPSR